MSAEGGGGAEGGGAGAGGGGERNYGGSRGVAAKLAAIREKREKYKIR